MRTHGCIPLASLALLAGTSALTLQQQPPLRTLTPEIRIVSSDSLPQTQLSRASDVLAAPDGFIFVAEMSSETGCIRLYDPNGRFVRSFGRLGQGPGEFSSNTDIVGAAGDTVLIYDRMRGYIHVFRRNGTFVRTQHLARHNVDRILRGYLGAGHDLVEIGYWTGRHNDSAAFRITDSTAREIARIAVQNAPPEPPSVPFVIVVGRQPFVPAVRTAQDPVGNRALAAVPSSYWGGQPGQVKLVVMNRDGIQSERIVNLGARRMTDAIRESWIKRNLDPRADVIRASGSPRAAVETKLRDGLVSGEYLPEIENALLGSDGAIWLKPYDLNDWVLVSPAGTIVAHVRVPAGLRVYQVSMDRLWGVMRDADGFPVIIRYKLSA